MVSLFVLSHCADNRLTSFIICSTPDRSVLVQTPWSFQAGVFLPSAHRCPLFIGSNVGSFLIQILSMNTAGVNHAPEISQPGQSEAKKNGEKKKIFLPLLFQPEWGGSGQANEAARLRSRMQGLLQSFFLRSQLCTHLSVTVSILGTEKGPCTQGSEQFFSL